MKISLIFDGSALTSNTLQQAVAAAGSNTSISVHTAQAVNISTLLAILSSAGNTKTLNLTFNGAQLTANNLEQAVAAAGTNTSIGVNTAQAVNISTLLSVLNTAGNTKKFSAEFNGAQLTANNLHQAVAAAGANTSISVNTAQAVNITTLLSVLNTAGATKKFSAEFNGAQLTANNLQQAVSAAGANTSISVNTAQAVNITTLLSVINTAGATKKFSAELNGAQLTANNLQQAVAAAGANTSISVNTAQAVNITTLLSALNTAGNTKKFSAEFNGAQLTANNLQQAVAAAGANTSISVNTAQAVNIATLLSVLSTAGSKRFSATFNGAQLTGNNLQQAAAAAGENTTIILNSAQGVPISTILDLIEIAG
jgi:methyl coenzyme M reductase alpha subunit